MKLTLAAWSRAKQRITAFGHSSRRLIINTWHHPERGAVVALSTIVLFAPILGCARQHATAPTTDPLIARVEEILQKDTANSADQAFIRNLNPEQLARIMEYYRTHPKAVPSTPGGTVVSLRTSEVESATATLKAETIECRDGFGGWIASYWFHTSACGGDGDDHYYVYPGVPGAYQYSGYLQGRSIHPGILMVLATYRWKLSAQVFTNNYVYICLGSRMHWFGITHEAWRTSFNLYSAR